MTNPACATRTGKVAMTKAQSRSPSRAAEVTRKPTQRTGMLVLSCKMPASPLACVAREPRFASTPRGDVGIGWSSIGAPRARCGDNAPALEFKPGGT